MASNTTTIALAATETALNTTELLEQILSCLSMPQILGKSRVCRKWKSVIDGSPSLQTTLFLRRREGQTGVVSPDRQFRLPEDVLQVAGGMDPSQIQFLFSLLDAPVYSTPNELNPLTVALNQQNLHFTHELTMRNPEASTASISGLQVIIGKYDRAFIRYRFGTEPLITQAKSSWRTMYLTAPPITDALIQLPMSEEGLNFVGNYRIEIHARTASLSVW
jgi:hypothetical protein